MAECDGKAVSSPTIVQVLTAAPKAVPFTQLRSLTPLDPNTAHRKDLINDTAGCCNAVRTGTQKSSSLCSSQFQNSLAIVRQYEDAHVHVCRWRAGVHSFQSFCSAV